MSEHVPLAQLFAGVFLALATCAVGSGLNNPGRISAALGVDGARTQPLEASPSGFVNAR